AARRRRDRLRGRRSGRPGRRPPAGAPRQRREDRDDVASGERTSGRCVVTVPGHHTRQVGGNPQAPRDVVDGGGFRDLERHGALRLGNGQVCEKRREEPDFDLQRSWAIRSRSPGRMWSWRSRRFQRSTSATDSPYSLAIELTVSCGRTTWISCAATAPRGALATGRRGPSAARTPPRGRGGTRTAPLG